MEVAFRMVLLLALWLVRLLSLRRSSFGLSRMRQERRILVPTKESDEIEYAKKPPAELAQGSHVPEMHDGVVTELPGMADVEALKSSVSHEVDLPVSELPDRASTMR
ncbi:hypothetical protein ASPBRDRAFT_678922 [Aspergillus brasiliensis CBS 101740]|uniref:Secreted protein n=1 Tax=Aspergillus brasiliensis (strain CBS 101740 / IMI 381727 / IBT 21946) TaxID=767769 RepID=A0A1L9UEW0_ASPBC|nr:hypothetical protein ASPBRDRAFT_678922 [Aspergillus brasiliensis CBS 101740]